MFFREGPIVELTQRGARKHQNNKPLQASSPQNRPGSGEMLGELFSVEIQARPMKTVLEEFAWG